MFHAVPLACLLSFLPASDLLSFLPASDLVEPRTMSLDEYLERGFDRRWLLPEERDDGAPDLVDEMRRLAASGWFGDAIAEARSGSVTKVLDRLGKRPPTGATSRAVSTQVPELLRERGFRKRGWDPDEDADDDGVLFVDAWDLERSTAAPWSRLEGSTRVEQGAILIHADLDAIKQVENDYGPYADHVGSSYEWIYPIARSHVRPGEDTDGEPYSGLWVRFRCDLPFPFTGYECHLRVLNRLDDSGHLVTDVYSTSEDFYWMAGRDVFLPVGTSDGAWVATLVVRQFGFDLKDVPDGDEHRRSAIRGGLGNLKLRAERLFRERGDGPRIVSGSIPAFEVRGERQR